MAGIESFDWALLKWLNGCTWGPWRRSADGPGRATEANRSSDIRSSGAFYVTLFVIRYEITRMFDDVRRPVSMIFGLLYQTTSS
jgi:hypothetical protein